MIKLNKNIELKFIYINFNCINLFQIIIEKNIINNNIELFININKYK